MLFVLNYDKKFGKRQRVTVEEAYDKFEEDILLIENTLDIKLKIDRSEFENDLDRYTFTLNADVECIKCDVYKIKSHLNCNTLFVS